MPLGLAGLLTIGVDTPYWQLAIWQLVIGAGSGLFTSPNTSAVMGVLPPAKLGIGASFDAEITCLTSAERATVADFVAFLAARHPSERGQGRDHPR